MSSCVNFASIICRPLPAANTLTRYVYIVPIHPLYIFAFLSRPVTSDLEKKIKKKTRKRKKKKTEGRKKKKKPRLVLS